MIKDIMDNMQDRMDRTLENLRTELSQIRTGKANAALLDGIRVDYYGTPSPLNQVATIAIPEPRLITIQPWDKTMITEIEKAIQKSDLGINPSNDGAMIRLPLPQLTKESREELAKQAKKKGEEGKVALRNIRRDANDALKKLEKSKDITEDDSRGTQDDVQKATDAAVAETDKIVEAKIEDIMTI